MAKMFCECGAEKTSDGIKDCKCVQSDGAFRTRLSRALTSMKEGADNSIAADFTKLSEQDIAKFKQEHHDKLGPNLKMAIRQQVNVTRKTQTLQKAMAKGHMKDEIDLREKYGKKPDQLAAIKQNAYSFICPIRRVQLYADPDFCTEWNFIQEDNTEQLLNLDTNDTARATKKAKDRKGSANCGRHESPETCGSDQAQGSLRKKCGGCK